MENKLFATVADLQSFTGVYPEESNNQQELFLRSATDIIIAYIGYDPTLQERHEIIDGTGDNLIFLNSKPITKVIKLKINNCIFSPDTFFYKKSTIVLKNGLFPIGQQNIEVQYESGYKNEELPNIIKLTCLRIAALLQTEGQENIGITSKSFGDSGSRTFYNFTSFNKYLSLLSNFQIM